MRNHYISKIQELESELKTYRNNFYGELDERIKNKIELYKNSFEDRMKQINEEYNNKLQEKDKMIDKWKASFTSQAMANAKLINKES